MVRPRFLLPFIALALFAASCTSAPPPESGSYSVTELLTARAAKDEQFRTASDSPVPPGRRVELLPLAYFPPDPSYSVPAMLVPPAGDQPLVEMPTSTGDRRKMRRVGTLEFSLKGHPLKLGAYVEEGDTTDRLFVPFTDLTTGSETYPGGRYLDLTRTATGIYVIDFNRAYEPYCAYDPKYDCPYPPPDNRLPIPIRAGERLKAAGGAQTR